MMDDTFQEQARILVVEDEGLIALDLKNKLTEMGYSVVGLARTGKEAIDKVEQTAPDLVLMDIRLEGEMDGVAAALQIRSRFDTPVIFLTAYADTETLQRAKVTSPDGYLIKPATERELRIVTSIAIHRSRVQSLIQTRARQQAAVAAFGQRALKGGSVDELTDEAVRIVATNLNVELCKFLVIQPDQNRFLLKTGVGWREGLVGRFTMPNNRDSLAGITLAENRPLIVEDLTKEKRLSGSNLLSDHGVVSGISLIVHGPQAPYGILGAHSTKKRSFTEDDINFVQAIANVISLVVEKEHAEEQKRKAEEQRRLAEASEKKRSEELARLKEEFFTSVSHELRTPLTLILAPLETLLGMEGMAGEVRQLLTTIHNNSVRLLQLVTGLLDFSKVGAGKVEVKLEPTDVAALTRSVLSDFAPLMDAKGIRCSLDSEIRLPIALVDRYLYERILFNLLSNAIKFTEPQGNISIRLRRSSPERIELAVQDSGIGISKEDQKYLFDRFRQVEGSSTRRFEGTGLGLALVKEFAELSSGRAWVESEPGSGSTFFVEFSAPRSETLPRDEFRSKRLQLVPLHTELQEPSSPFPQIGQRLPTILIAEDNIELVQYISTLLGKTYRIHVAHDGEQALAMARALLPDLILSDVMMPKLDGVELCRRLKSNGPLSSIPVILLTALTHRDALLRGWDAGADEYLFKPFHPQELVTRVRSILAAVQERKHREEEKKRREELEEFAHFASHDLREPLRQITNFSQVLKKSLTAAPGTSIEQTLNFIVDGATRMQQLIDGLTDYSKVAGQEVPPEPVDCNLVLDEAIRNLEPSIIESEAQISRKPLPKVTGRHSLLVTVFQNLLGNALKYRSPGRKPQIEIWADRVANEWVFSVRDNGMGFAPKYAQHIFVMFKRLHPSHQYPGSGLGLAICKRVVERHKGRIWAESEEGKGSTFTFTLPALAQLGEENDDSRTEGIAPAS